ncbi:UPF0193 protein EVG1 isoform X1 [Micropterus dolomieu]|uniref:UPF0193 protein EVG1 isoform X1 n=1 Tax=Micropterus dolomieu TaxID=147949 RepID=UPI001E8E9DA9|nr:UPF0193 protein EVG1 isoform X1 [Micropterus dolomieu]XP_045903455.1 UPF0193 protein EVG1 isoform X1 [Micropterus dolomieu]XP_045903456.1 UPF0193 protein EVG1 isoform X1 [Micropterus dolomieu]XP_045903457.1 UPF0193 protein EVG1 isoform X1 [Micropterus dolomieu]
MEPSSQSRGGRGLWSNPRATQYSKETQDLLTLMMQESRLTNLQRKQINDCLKNGAALPLTSDPISSASPPQPKTNKSVQKRLPSKPQKRSAESCRSGNSYVREKFQPGPIRDLEKEKRRLQSILATGEEEPTAASYQNVPTCRNPGAAEGRDRYQEVLDEIKDRRQFLEDMTSLGQEKQYISIINTEISQRLRELEELDKARSAKMDAMTSEGKGVTPQQTTEKMDLKETHCH